MLPMRTILHLEHEQSHGVRRLHDTLHKYNKWYTLTDDAIMARGIPFLVCTVNGDFSQKTYSPAEPRGRTPRLVNSGDESMHS